MESGSGRALITQVKCFSRRGIPRAEKSHPNDAYRNRHRRQLTLKSHMIYLVTFLSPCKSSETSDAVYGLLYGTVKGIRAAYVFEVVIIMCGLSRFPQRVIGKSHRRKILFRNFKIIILPQTFYFLHQEYLNALVQLSFEVFSASAATFYMRKIRYIDISGFPLECTSKEDIKIQQSQ